MKKIALLFMFLCFICFTAESALPRLDKSASFGKILSSGSTTNNSTVVDKDSSEIYNSPTSSNAA